MTAEQKQALIEVQRYSVCEGWIVADEGGRLVTYEAFLALAQRAEAAEAKLAGLEKQEPVAWLVLNSSEGYVERNPDVVSFLEAAGLTKCKPLFTRPAPAADLADLLSRVVDSGALTSPEHEAIEAECCSILRNIEEAK
ncbi:hypothetical protein [Pantoea agglomerans]|uniref:hypothetical protein n=1 Tax=Enterobacter agglomerans TaxID=549 RepID=UPI001FD6DFF0|nr:hypothetical protein [Pantoea agglomerans]UOV19263.1 hypothetical protein LZ609_04600 [Pantoea agglomerans]